MNIAQKLLASTMQRYGSARCEWPRGLRILLSLIIALNRACRRDWQAAQVAAANADLMLRERYTNELADLAISDTMHRRLQTITAMPQISVKRKKSGGIAFWRVSFASAMASALLGVVLGAGGYVDELGGSDAVYLESAMTYEVSDWLAAGENP